MRSNIEFLSWCMFDFMFLNSIDVADLKFDHTFTHFTLVFGKVYLCYSYIIMFKLLYVGMLHLNTYSTYFKVV